MAVPRFPLTSVLGLAVTQVQNIMFSELGLPGPRQRQNREVQQLSSWTCTTFFNPVISVGHLDWFHNWAILNAAPIKQGVQLSLLYVNLHSFQYMPKSDIA
jgi:hypothetical protein